MTNLVIAQIPHGSPQYDAMVALRYAVLREPLGLNYTPEELAREQSEELLGCYDGNSLVGCFILVRKNETLLGVKQVAVSPNHQRTGIGRAIMTHAEDFAHRNRFTKITLHARENAVPFYEKLGYHRVGEPFEQVTITHWVMQKPVVP